MSSGANSTLQAAASNSSRPDQHAADFLGAGADLVELGIAQQPSRRVRR